MNPRRRTSVMYTFLVWAVILVAGVAYAAGLYLFALAHGGP